MNMLAKEKHKKMQPLLEIKALKKYFPVNDSSLFKKDKNYIKAVDSISFKVYEGETLGIVGESGCGKSTMGRAILQLQSPTSGEVWFKGKDITRMKRNKLRKLRKDIQIIFQDPYGSLNQKMTVGDRKSTRLNSSHVAISYAVFC